MHIQTHKEVIKFSWPKSKEKIKNQINNLILGIGVITQPCYSKELNESYGPKNKTSGLPELESWTGKHSPHKHKYKRRTYKVLCPSGQG